MKRFGEAGESNETRPENIIPRGGEMMGGPARYNAEPEVSVDTDADATEQLLPEEKARRLQQRIKGKFPSGGDAEKDTDQQSGVEPGEPHWGEEGD